MLSRIKSGRLIAQISLLLMAVSVSHVSAEQVLHGHEASPNHYEKLHENAHVLVLRMTLAPGERDALHRHHNETVYFERGGRLMIQLPGEQTVTADVPDGHIMWHEAWEHQVTNIGDTPVVAIIVESKKP